MSTKLAPGTPSVWNPGRLHLYWELHQLMCRTPMSKGEMSQASLPCVAVGVRSMCAEANSFGICNLRSPG